MSKYFNHATSLSPSMHAEKIQLLLMLVSCVNSKALSDSGAAMWARQVPRTIEMISSLKRQKLGQVLVRSEGQETRKVRTAGELVSHARDDVAPRRIASRTAPVRFAVVQRWRRRRGRRRRRWRRLRRHWRKPIRALERLRSAACF